MILEDAGQLETLAAEVNILRRSQQHGQALAHREQLVDALLARARTATASGAALSQRLSEIPPQSPLLENALARIGEWRSALEADIGHALGGDLFGRFQDSVGKAIGEIERRTATAWQRYVNRTRPETSEEILAALEDDPLAGSTVARIRRLSEKLHRLRECAIPTLEELSEFDSATAELDNAWSTLDVASLNDEVVAFLRAAHSDHGAPLPLLTASVVDWLEQRGATSHYVIRPADLRWPPRCCPSSTNSSDRRQPC